MKRKGDGFSLQNIPVVREWGSWAVFIYSCSAGLAAGLLTRPWQAGGGFSLRTLASILGLTLLVNAKAPLGEALRSKKERTRALFWLYLFVLGGCLLLLPFVIGAPLLLLASFLLVVCYTIFVSTSKEHFLLAELNGFALLTLSAPIVYFVVTGDVHWKLYSAVLVYFSAGVLKVRARLKKTVFYRILMIAYCMSAVLGFYYFSIPVILLLPLIENIFSVVLMKEEKLRTTGNVELVKGALFLFLVGFFWA